MANAISWLCFSWRPTNRSDATIATIPTSSAIPFQSANFILGSCFASFYSVWVNGTNVRIREKQTYSPRLTIDSKSRHKSDNAGTPTGINEHYPRSPSIKTNSYLLTGDCAPQCAIRYYLHHARQALPTIGRNRANVCSWRPCRNWWMVTNRR